VTTGESYVNTSVFVPARLVTITAACVVVEKPSEFAHVTEDADVHDVDAQSVVPITTDGVVLDVAKLVPITVRLAAAVVGELNLLMKVTTGES
jgi:hypothetical protein